MIEKIQIHIDIKLVVIAYLFPLIVPLASGNYQVHAQDPGPEIIYVHFDKSFYLTGETIYFKVYFQNKDIVPSKIVHIDLADKDGNSYMNQILEIGHNVATGIFDIPYNLKESNYLFRCYTQWNLNFGPSYIYYKVIPIYNEFLEDSELDFVADTILDAGIPGFPEGGSPPRLSLKIINTSAIHRGDQVEVEIGMIDDNKISPPANLSLSVVQGSISDLTDRNMILINQGSENVPSIMLDMPYTPEDSITIKGIARNPQTRELVHSRVLSIYNVEDVSFTRLSSKKGAFNFKIPLFEGSTDLQIINMNPFQPKVPEIEWIPLDKELPPNPDFSPEAIRSNKVKEYIFYARLRNRINEIFYSSTYDSIQLQQPPILPFIPDRSYDMTKYQLIRDLFNFFKEGVLNTSFFKENGEEKIRLFNRDTKKTFMTSPWFVVDGHFIFNDSLVHHIPFNHLSRIDIFDSNHSILKYFEPIMIQGGVVAVYTRNNFLIDYIQEMPNTLKVNGIAGNKPVEKIKDVAIPGRDHETPDFNPLIYWNANILTDKDGKARVSFNMNDITGNIIIEVKGIDRSGQLLSGYLNFEVK